jgi:glycosyltransferase involved in cell wall biosynthesis
MKILHVIDVMSVGGAQFLVKGILETYSENDDYLFVLRKSSDLINVNHTNIFFSESKKKYSFLPIFEMLRIIKKFDIDILHCYLLKSQIFGWVIKAFYRKNIKLVFHEQGEIMMNNSLIFKLFMKISSKKVNHYFAASISTKNELIRKADINKDKISVLYNYIILSRFNPENKLKFEQSYRKDFDITESQIVVGYAGRLSKEKGCEILIRAIPFINHNIKVLIAGSGIEKTKLIKLAENLGVTKKIVFLDFVEDMIKFYSSTNIHIIPSHFESFGLIAIEAQAIGIPVIASNIPGLNEVVINNENGLLFENGNSKELASKISEIIENEDLKSKIIKGGFENAKKFGIEPYYKNMASVYNNL